MSNDLTETTTLTGELIAGSSLLHDANELGLLSEATTEPQDVGTSGMSVFVPPGYTHKIVDNESYGDLPKRRRRNVVLTRTSALVDYLRRFVNPIDCTLYVNPITPGVIGVLDDTDGWRDDRVALQWRQTTGWLRWSNASGKMLDQETFADLIEEGLTEIARPTGADLLELAQSIHATTDARFSSDRRIVSGQVQLSYVETINATAGSDGKMTIPSTIELVLAPFEGAAPRQISARLRYRVTQGKLSLGIVLNQPTEFLLDAVDQEVQAIIEAHPEVLTVWGQP